MRAPVASIVILSWNRPASTRTTLQALSAIPSGVEHEVIVVDNGSGVQTLEVLRELQAQGLMDRLVLLPENRGTSPGYNAGFRAADPRSVFCTKLDNDVELLTPNWLGALIAALEENPGIGIASTEITNHEGIQQLPIVHLESGQAARDWIGCPAGGAGMTFRRALFDSIGGFRERYSDGLLLMPDDLEFYFRIQERGLRAFYLHDIRSRTVDHLEQTPLPYQAFKKRQYFLLRTRHFGVARDAHFDFLPHLTSIEVLPVIVTPGKSLRVRCELAAASRRAMALGCTLVAADDTVVPGLQVMTTIETAAPGSRHEWVLPLPGDLSPGSYRLKLALWKEASAQTASERLADLVQMTEAIEVVPEGNPPGDEAPPEERQSSPCPRFATLSLIAPGIETALALDLQAHSWRAVLVPSRSALEQACGCEEEVWSYLRQQGHDIAAQANLPPGTGASLTPDAAPLPGSVIHMDPTQGEGEALERAKRLLADAPAGSWIHFRIPASDHRNALSLTSVLARIATDLGVRVRSLSEDVSRAPLRLEGANARPQPSCHWPSPLGGSPAARFPPRDRSRIKAALIPLLQELTRERKQVLQIGVGTSELAAALTGTGVLLRGIAITQEELLTSQPFQSDDYRVSRPEDLPGMVGSGERFDLILDPHLLGPHCCARHFLQRLTCSTSLLAPDGLILAPTVDAPATIDSGFQPLLEDLRHLESNGALRIVHAPTTHLMLASARGASPSHPPIAVPALADLPGVLMLNGVGVQDAARPRAMTFQVCLPDQTPLALASYVLRLPDGTLRLGRTDASGHVRHSAVLSRRVVGRQGSRSGHLCLECGPGRLILHDA
ncbi:glycosyltransferase family 2 protein [Corallococcus llansteffanensis]|uniref:Glycosyltransferase n=1 Tax=Corallococcus llansteffanensis TaxID=2316731 RepID=A0A3A8QHV7_9BACT|nr:glycosyltransferase [Corallococcus llansteffanensis]RKH64472.1 glycosyltransferase [Corallococcus llansteffanensis]